MLTQSPSHTAKILFNFWCFIKQFKSLRLHPVVQGGQSNRNHHHHHQVLLVTRLLVWQPPHMPIHYQSACNEKVRSKIKQKKFLVAI